MPVCTKDLAYLSQDTVDSDRGIFEKLSAKIHGGDDLKKYQSMKSSE